MTGNISSNGLVEEFGISRKGITARKQKLGIVGLMTEQEYKKLKKDLIDNPPKINQVGKEELQNSLDKNIQQKEIYQANIDRWRLMEKNFKTLTEGLAFLTHDSSLKNTQNILEKTHLLEEIHDKDEELQNLYKQKVKAIKCMTLWEWFRKNWKNKYDQAINLKENEIDKLTQKYNKKSLEIDRVKKLFLDSPQPKFEDEYGYEHGTVSVDINTNKYRQKHKPDTTNFTKEFNIYNDNIHNAKVVK